LGLRVPLLLGLTALQCIRCIAINLYSDLVRYRKVYPLYPGERVGRHMGRQKKVEQISLGWARTSDLPVNSRALCQLSYEGIRQRIASEKLGYINCNSLRI
jgi:hypothetical protein